MCSKKYEESGYGLDLDLLTIHIIEVDWATCVFHTLREMG